MRGLELPCSMGDLPGPGIEPVSSALAGGFLTPGPPGKSRVGIIFWCGEGSFFCWLCWVFVAVGLFSSCTELGRPSSSGAGPSQCGTQALGPQDAVVVVPGPQSTGPAAVAQGPHTVHEPASPAAAAPSSSLSHREAPNRYTFKTGSSQEFPGGLVTRTPDSHC